MNHHPSTSRPGLHPLRPWLERLPTPALAGYAVVVAFCAYFCMYAFRRPFAAAAYEGDGIGLFGEELALKTVFVLSQIIGYCLSKYIGIKVCSELPHRRLLWCLLAAIAIAEVALLLFAVAPPSLKFAALFLNGLPLGMVWGLVVRYLEGRTTSEVLLAGLSCSFIIASGIVRTVGRHVMNEWGVDEYWMPVVTGLLFLGPFVLFAWLLDQLPPPTQRDVDLRTYRQPLDRAGRWRFMKAFLPGMILLCVAYFFLTAYRDYRDNYMLEIYGHFKTEQVLSHALGEGTLDRHQADAVRLWLSEEGGAEDRRARQAVDYLLERGWLTAQAAASLENDGLDVGSDLFAATDLPVGFGVLIPLALLALVRNNRRGLAGAYLIMLSGMILMGAATWLMQQQQISPYWWMVSVGLGAYLAYVPYGSVLFDRTIAATRFAGTAVFAIYLVDAIGYTGSVGIQIYKDLFAGQSNRGEFFISFTWFMVGTGAIILVASAVYFLRRAKASEVE